MYDTEVNGEEGNKVEAPRCGLCGWIPSSEKLKQYWNTVAFMKKQLKNMDQNNLKIKNTLRLVARCFGRCRGYQQCATSHLESD
ncbi:hypothetical protein E2C01_073088 [Portunus trituberculatus]|uniref:Uncharacterized protein n=1 Tax=Portunus trituberculatus TaxID=210409 RepID=A0A5B7IAR2_PORTR|nr:hypothetical protein [Portunus trituberculatus]